MKAVVFRGPGDVAVEETPEPRIEAPGDAIVQVTLSAVGGSDVAAFGDRRPRHPGTIGHEFVGRVEAMGDGAGRVEVGGRYVSPPATFCGGCFYCKQGLLDACSHRRVFGLDLPGAQATHVRVPDADAVLEPVPARVSDEQAVFLAELLPAAFAGLVAAGVKAGDCLAVLGCGPTGLSAQLLAVTMGASQVFAIDHHAYRLAAAAGLGATPLNFESDDLLGRVHAATDGRGADIVVEATGTAAALVTAIDLVRPYGTVLSLGIGNAGGAEFPAGRLLARHGRLIGAGSAPVKNHIAPLAKMIARGVIDPTPLVSHTLPLEDAPRAYALMAQRQDGALKVLLRP